MPAYPSNVHSLLRLLFNLGFELKTGGRHNYKFIHPTKKANIGNRNFIIISTNVSQGFSRIVFNELKESYGFTDKEIEFCLKKPIYKYKKA